MAKTMREKREQALAWRKKELQLMKGELKAIKKHKDNNTMKRLKAAMGRKKIEIAHLEIKLMDTYRGV